MNINVSIMLAENEVVEKTSDEVANEVLRVLGGDETKDFCTVSFMPTMPVPGSAGTPPAPPPPPPAPPEV
jgi:hypothetical protein